MATTWTTIEIQFEREDDEGGRAFAEHLFDCVADFAIGAGEDFGTDVHVSATMHHPPPDWAVGED